MRSRLRACQVLHDSARVCARVYACVRDAVPAKHLH